MPNIDLDDEFMKLFYGVTNEIPPKTPNLIELKKQLINIIDMIKEISSNPKKANYAKFMSQDEEEQQGKSILIVDDLGVITYQLKVLLSQFDYDIDCSQEIYDAVNKYKKRKYSYVIMDLFIPTEREGFILLTELKKMAEIAGVNTTVGVITASPRKETEVQCRARGADFFLEKNNDWQNTLFNIMKEYIDVVENKNKEEEEF